MTMYSLNRISGYIEDTDTSKDLIAEAIIQGLISDADDLCTIEIELFESADDAIRKMNYLTPYTVRSEENQIFALGYYIQTNEYEYLEGNYSLLYYGDIYSYYTTKL